MTNKGECGRAIPLTYLKSSDSNFYTVYCTVPGGHTGSDRSRVPPAAKAAVDMTAMPVTAWTYIYIYVCRSAMSLWEPFTDIDYNLVNVSSVSQCRPKIYPLDDGLACPSHSYSEFLPFFSRWLRGVLFVLPHA